MAEVSDSTKDELVELAHRAVAGDKAAFVEIVAHYQAMVSGITLAILKDFAASEDAAHDEARLILSSLNSLPEKYRLPLILFYREEHSIRVVAETLGLSQSVVKQRLYRGRKMLRDHIECSLDVVLTRTVPAIAFTAGVATAIGSSSFSAEAAAGKISSLVVTSEAPGASSMVVTASTTMNLKLSLTTALVVTLACLPVGYGLRHLTSSSAAEEPLPSHKGVERENRVSFHLADSELVAEWKSLLERYGSSSEGMGELHEHIQNLEDPFRREAFLSALILQWAEIDPAGGMDYLRNEGGDYLQLFDEWIKRDAAAAIANIKASNAGWKHILYTKLPEIVRYAPELLAELVLEVRSPRGLWDDRIERAFTIASKSDSGSLREIALSLEGSKRVQALAGIAAGWAESDGRAAFLWTQEALSGDEQISAARAALAAWAKTDPLAALNHLHLVPPRGGNGSTAAQVLKSASATNFDSTMQWLREHPGTMGSEDYQGLDAAVRKRLIADPIMFLDKMQSQGSIKDIERSLVHAVLNTGTDTWRHVVSWLDVQTPSPRLNQLRDDLLGTLTYTDPDSAIAYAQVMTKEQGRSEALNKVTRSILNGKASLDLAKQYAARFPDSSEFIYRNAFENLHDQLTGDPRLWAESLEKVPQRDREMATRKLTRAWAEQDPDAAVDWLTTLTDPRQRIQGMAETMAVWMRNDSHAAAERLQQMPEGIERDLSVMALVNELGEEHPQEALDWVKHIGVSGERLRAAGKLMNFSEDPLLMLEKSNLSEEVKDYLRTLLEKP